MVGLGEPAVGLALDPLPVELVLVVPALGVRPAAAVVLEGAVDFARGGHLRRRFEMGAFWLSIYEGTSFANSGNAFRLPTPARNIAKQNLVGNIQERRIFVMFLTWADAGDHGHVVDGYIAEAVLSDDALEHNLGEMRVAINKWPY